MATRRVVRVMVTPQALATALHLPEGVVVARCGYDFDCDAISLILSGDAFPECEQGEVIPIVLPLYHVNEDGSVRPEWPYYGAADSYGVPA